MEREKDKNIIKHQITVAKCNRLQRKIPERKYKVEKWDLYEGQKRTQDVAA